MCRPDAFVLIVATTREYAWWRQAVRATDCLWAPAGLLTREETILFLPWGVLSSQILLAPGFGLLTSDYCLLASVLCLEAQRPVVPC